jgi:hypothetical protein
MTSAFIPVWILGGAFIGSLIVAFSFRGPSAMSGGVGYRSNDNDVVRNPGYEKTAY